MKDESPIFVAIGNVPYNIDSANTLGKLSPNLERSKLMSLFANNLWTFLGSNKPCKTTFSYIFNECNLVFKSELSELISLPTKFRQKSLL